MHILFFFFFKILNIYIFLFSFLFLYIYIYTFHVKFILVSTRGGSVGICICVYRYALWYTGMLSGDHEIYFRCISRLVMLVSPLYTLYAHIQIYTHTYIYIHPYPYTFAYIHKHIYMKNFINTYTHIHNIHIYTFIFTNIISHFLTLYLRNINYLFSII